MHAPGFKFKCLTINPSLYYTLPNNMTVAISTMTMFTETPVKVTHTPISTGSLQFTGSALVFHKTSGEPFTVTYTVDAVARSPNQ